MAQTINTNILSLNAQRNLNTSQAALAVAMQRLSSGLRVNSAKDDAAGLAISERFTTQIRGFNQAIRNANDGISLSQVGEGALAELTSNLQRIRELAVQSANATNSDSDRKALDLEVQQRLAEIDRISAQTTFNGRKLLDGTFGNATFQVGPDAGQVIALNLPESSRISSLGKIAQTASLPLGNEAVGGSKTIGPLGPTLFEDSNPNASLDGGVTISAGTFLFGRLETVGTGGSIELAGLAGTTDFNVLLAPAADLPGTNIQTVPAGLIPGGPGLNLSTTDTHAQFDVTISPAAAVGVTLNRPYANGDEIATHVQDQLTAAGLSVTVTYDPAGELKFENTAGATAVTITKADINATNVLGIAENTGALEGGTTNAVKFTVNGTPVVLAGTYLDEDAVAAEITLQLAGTNLSAEFDNTKIPPTYKISSAIIGSPAPTIVAANVAAYDAGWDNTTGTVAVTQGQNTVTPNATNFVVDSTYLINLNQDYISFDDLAEKIGDQLELQGGNYTVSNVGNEIKIINNDGVSAVAISAAGLDSIKDSIATTAGFGPQSGDFTKNIKFSIDGTEVTLNQNFVDTPPDTALELMAADILSQLPEGAYTVDAVDTDGVAGFDSLKITNATDIEPVVISATPEYETAVQALGIVLGEGERGVSAGAIVVNNLTINGIELRRVNPEDPTGPALPFTDAKHLADTINQNVADVYASLDSDGRLQVISSLDIVIAGSDAEALLGTSGTLEAKSGSLLSKGVTTVEAANDMLVRVDSALTYVSNLRSTFGAIQNRFESVISNLSTAAENLSASRSRIMDADFAQETAALSRAQILQQAGTAMVAQANQVPQGVLQLLQG